MSIIVQCSNCQRQFFAPDAALGKTGKCPNCGERIRIHPMDDIPSIVEVPPERIAAALESSSRGTTIFLAVVSTIVVAVLATVAYLIFAPESAEPVIAAAPAFEEGAPEAPTAALSDIPSDYKTADNGLGLSLAEFKQDIPIGESWKIFSDSRNDDGTVAFQLTSTVMSNVMLMAYGQSDDLREVSVTCSFAKEYKEADLIARLLTMVHYLSKYSHWTDEEIGAFIGRVLKVASDGNTDFRVAKDGQELYVGFIPAQGGVVVITSVNAKPNSDAPTLQSWLADHPVKVDPTLTHITSGVGQVGNSDFTFKGVRHKGRGDFVGEITNNSGKHFQAASFRLSVYNASGEILDTGQLSIVDFAVRQTRSFATFVDDGPIAYYKIDLELGL
ncbi:MAG: FxLYD domain-containing protein [Pirellulales bacterium]